MKKKKTSVFENKTILYQPQALIEEHFLNFAAFYSIDLSKIIFSKMKLWEYIIKSNDFRSQNQNRTLVFLRSALQ